MIEAICRVVPDLDKASLLAGSESPAVLHETGAEGVVGAKVSVAGLPGARYVPQLSWAQAGALNAGWTDERFEGTGVLTTVKDRRAFALTNRGSSMAPEINDGDQVIVCPSEEIKAGDRVVVRTMEGDVHCKVYKPQGSKEIQFVSVNPAHDSFVIPKSEIAWVYRIGQVLKNY